FFARRDESPCNRMLDSLHLSEIRPAGLRRGREATMMSYRLDRMRKRVGWAAFGVLVVGAAWMASPGLPVLRAPRASAATKSEGLALFEHEWRPNDPLAKGDGLGPVFNARSCAACHFQGGVGGGGDNSHNVLAFEAHPTRDRPDVKGGLVHKFAVELRF